MTGSTGNDLEVRRIDRVRVRIRRTGAAAAGVTFLLSLVGVPASLRLPPGLLSLVLIAAVALTVGSAVAEWRDPGAADSATPWRSSLMIGLALVVALPTGWLSMLWAVGVTMPADCAPFVPPDGGDPAHEAHCAASSPAQTAGMVAWVTVMATTALLLVAFAIKARRSRTVGWAAVPVVCAGCVIAVDLAHTTTWLLEHLAG